MVFQEWQCLFNIRTQRNTVHINPLGAKTKSKCTNCYAARTETKIKTSFHQRMNEQFNKTARALQISLNFFCCFLQNNNVKWPTYEKRVLQCFKWVFLFAMLLLCYFKAPKSSTELIFPLYLAIIWGLLSIQKLFCNIQISPHSSLAPCC